MNQSVMDSIKIDWRSRCRGGRSRLLWRWVGIVSIVGAAIALPVRPAIALTLGQIPGSAEEHWRQANGAEPAATGDMLQTYTLPGSFSLQIPTEWSIEAIEGDRTAVITNFDPARATPEAPHPTDIRTEITVVREHPDTFVNREITALIEQQAQVQRYAPVMVDNFTALRLWVESPPSGYAHQMITFVGYASYGTAVLVTEYNAPAAETEALIEQIHNSFELLF